MAYSEADVTDVLGACIYIAPGDVSHLGTGYMHSYSHRTKVTSVHSRLRWKGQQVRLTPEWACLPRFHTLCSVLSLGEGRHALTWIYFEVFYQGTIR